MRVTHGGLVAKSQAERTKQGKPIFDTAPKSADVPEAETPAASADR